MHASDILTFAVTGGEGVHFSLLVRNGKLTEDAPVVMTTPTPDAIQNYIVGENLRDFLCLRVNRGYFYLDFLPSDDAFQKRIARHQTPRRHGRTSNDPFRSTSTDGNSCNSLSGNFVWSRGKT